MIGPKLSQRITVYHPTGKDSRGNPTGVTTPNVPCRITYGNRLIRGPDGTQAPSRAVVETKHLVVVGDLITLPDGTKQAVLDVRPISGIGGKESHREVYL